MKKTLTILLALILAISMFPIQVMAADEQSEIGEAAVYEETVTEPEAFQPANDKYESADVIQAMEDEEGEEAIVFPVEVALSDTVSFTITEDGVMTVSGTGAMPADSYEITGDYQAYVDKLVVSSGITRISEGAFYGYVYLTSISLPSTVTSIDQYAFALCDSLTKVTIPSKVKILQEGIFWNCPKLTFVKLPASATTIHAGAFFDTALTTVAIPSKVDEVPYEAFPHNCKITGFLNSITYNGAKIREGAVHVSSKRKYDYAFKVLTIVNKERKKKGLKSLTMDTSLLSTAMKRSAETAMYFEHQRPNGLMCFSANSKMFGENIAAGQKSPEAVMKAWMNSPGHKANILGDYTTIGIGCVKIGNYYYWTQCFGKSTATKAYASKYKNKTVSEKIVFLPQAGYKFIGSAGPVKYKKSRYVSLKVYGSMEKIKIKRGDFTYKSSSTKYATVSKYGKVYGKKRGKATITITMKGAPKIYLKRTATVK